MGVPILFAWMNQKHTSCLKSTPPQEADNLYVDFNALIHNCYNPNLGSIKEIHADIVDRLTASIDNLVARTSPKNILYIAVDGVAPAAKLAHQRGRRFKAASEKKILFESKSLSEIKIEDNNKPEDTDNKWEEVIIDNEIIENNFSDKFEPEDEISVEDLDLLKESKASFDSNSISPGTELMEYLHEELLKVFQYKLSTDKRYKDLKIIYSSYLVPGEGEQKIMKFIRKYHLTNPNAVHVMYSPDGDVIFLGVGMLNVKFFIMREDTYNSKNKKSVCNTCSKTGHNSFECGKPFLAQFTYIDILSFISVLCREFSQYIKGNFDKKRMLHDWIMSCFLIGNDFIPGMPCLDIKIASIEALTSLLCRNYIATKEHLTMSDGNFNFNALEAFMMSLARVEDGYYVAKTRLLDRYLQGQSREHIPLHTREGKMKYYNLKLHVNNQEGIDNVSIEYVTGLLWVFNYYIKGFTDWNWVYPYHFAPFASDISRVCRSRFRLKPGYPLSPFEQLLVLIPPQSIDLIPEKMHFLYEKHKKYFPTEVKIDNFDKYLSWAGIVMLPHLNFTPILKESRNVINKMAVSELKRNIIDTDLLIVNDKDLSNRIFNIYLFLKPFDKIVLNKLTMRISPYHLSNFPEDEVVLKDNLKFVNKTIISRIDKI